MITKEILFVLPNLRTGGAQKTYIRLANILYKKGIDLEIIILGGIDDLYKAINPNIKCTFFKKKRISSAFWKLCIYLKKTKPRNIITCMNYMNVLTTIASKLTTPKSKIIISERGVFSEETNLGKLYYFLFKILSSLTYRLSDEIIAVSEGVANDLSKTLKLKKEKIKVIYNPTVSKELIRKSHELIKSDDLYFFKKPTIISIGRLEDVKGYDLLIKAFSIVLKEIDASLIIIGEGSLRKNLINLSKKLKVNKSIWLPGIISNPYPYLKKADVFVLSSRLEGLPNVLIEAMALGKTVISTNCRYGPSEIIGNNKWGYLIEEENPVEMALNIINVLVHKKHINAELRAQDFHEEKIYKEYLKLFK